MPHYVYMLKTINGKHNKTYVGYTNNLKKRVELHNKGKGAKSTKGHKWLLIYYERYSSKNEALQNEYSLKNNYNLRQKIKKIYLKTNEK
tara:strand:- start:1142 stop:1408 length:267 start_codon:yes stop_codon:yes gene_type:complete